MTLPIFWPSGWILLDSVRGWRVFWRRGETEWRSPGRTHQFERQRGQIPDWWWGPEGGIRSIHLQQTRPLHSHPSKRWPLQWAQYPLHWTMRTRVPTFQLRIKWKALPRACSLPQCGPPSVQKVREGFVKLGVHGYFSSWREKTKAPAQKVKPK